MARAFCNLISIISISKTKRNVSIGTHVLPAASVRVVAASLIDSYLFAEQSLLDLIPFSGSSQM